MALKPQGEDGERGETTETLEQLGGLESHREEERREGIGEGIGEGNMDPQPQANTEVFLHLGLLHVKDLSSIYSILKILTYRLQNY